ncbi:hypothetical protein [Acinetobacter lactucae]|uniref:hypothetical protein n=1 Tax=Acinetobacter lactucae TaxID=1785128 RepID=UPI0015F6CBF9|nr:hypothetical protein [Acinetobacter lactucae]
MPIFLDEQLSQGKFSEAIMSIQTRFFMKKLIGKKRGIGRILLKRSALIKAFVTFFQYIAINFFIYKF